MKGRRPYQNSKWDCWTWALCVRRWPWAGGQGGRERGQDQRWWSLLVFPCQNMAWLCGPSCTPKSFPVLCCKWEEDACLRAEQNTPKGGALAGRGAAKGWVPPAAGWVQGLCAPFSSPSGCAGSVHGCLHLTGSTWFEMTPYLKRGPKSHFPNPCQVPEGCSKS